MSVNFQEGTKDSKKKRSSEVTDGEGMCEFLMIYDLPNKRLIFDTLCELC